MSSLPPISSSTRPPVFAVTPLDTNRRPTLAPTVNPGPALPSVGAGRLPTHSGSLPTANADGVVTRRRGVTGYVGNFFSSMFSSGRSGRS